MIHHPCAQQSAGVQAVGRHGLSVSDSASGRLMFYLTDAIAVVVACAVGQSTMVFS